MLLVGSAQVVVSPDEPVVMGGSFKHYLSVRVQDPLYASCVVLEDDSLRMAWISCDVGSFMNETVTYIRQQVEASTGIRQDRIMVSATHTHGTPFMGPSSVFSQTDDVMIQKIADRAAYSVVLASKNMKPARIGYANGPVEKCTFNRRYVTSSGRSKMHPRAPEDRLLKEGPEDNELQTVWFEEPDGKLIAVLVNFSSHPAMTYGRDFLTADYPGVVRQTVQTVYGQDIPVLFLLGACGNVGTFDYNDNRWGTGLDGICRIGRMIGGEVVKHIASEYACEADSPVLDLQSLELTLPYKAVPHEMVDEANQLWQKFSTMSAEEIDRADTYEKSLANRIRLLEREKQTGSRIQVAGIRIGDLFLVTNPAELFVEYQLALKRLHSSRKVILAEQTNGKCGYVPTRQAIALGGYEAANCMHVPEAGDMILKASAALIDRLAKKAMPASH